MKSTQICIQTTSGMVCYSNALHGKRVHYQVTYQLLKHRPRPVPHGSGTLRSGASSWEKLMVLIAALPRIPAGDRRRLRLGGWFAIIRK